MTVDLNTLAGQAKMRVIIGEKEYIFCRVAQIVNDERGVKVGAEALRLSCADGDALTELVDQINQAMREPMIYEEQLVDPEMFEGGRFVVQRRVHYGDYPEYCDVTGEDTKPVRYSSREEAQGAIDNALAQKLALETKAYEKSERAREKELEKFNKRKAVLEREGLWAPGLLPEPRRARSKPVLSSGEEYRIVGIEESCWFMGVDTTY